MIRVYAFIAMGVAACLVLATVYVSVKQAGKNGRNRPKR